MLWWHKQKKFDATDTRRNTCSKSLSAEEFSHKWTEKICFHYENMKMEISKSSYKLFTSIDQCVWTRERTKRKEGTWRCNFCGKNFDSQFNKKKPHASKRMSVATDTMQKGQQVVKQTKALVVGCGHRNEIMGHMWRKSVSALWRFQSVWQIHFPRFSSPINRGFYILSHYASPDSFIISNSALRNSSSTTHFRYNILALSIFNIISQSSNTFSN